MKTDSTLAPTSTAVLSAELALTDAYVVLVSLVIERPILLDTIHKRPVNGACIVASFQYCIVYNYIMSFHQLYDHAITVVSIW
jgi:hypothetical protein